MGNTSQIKKKSSSRVYIISKSPKKSLLIKRQLKNSIDEEKIAVIDKTEDLPSNISTDTYVITEHDKKFISAASRLTPKRNLKLFVFIDNIYSLNEDDVFFLIKKNFDRIITFDTLKNLKYERFIDSKIFKKKRYNVLIDKESTLLADLCYKFDNNINIYGVSDKINDTVEKSIKIARSESNVLISGESGTGKELIARLIHFNSRRKDNPMVSVNCGAFPEGLLESELFGHKKGAFTGAFNDKPGRFELANNSTIFLDEIGDMSLTLQVKLLRVIQEREIEPLGSVKTKKIDVRIISATNKNLEDLISKNLFREDFYYRINVVPIEIPPLRERKIDIIILAYYFLKKFSSYQNENVYGISEDAMQLLLGYQWYGNIREIENLMEMLVVLSENGLITAKDIPEKYVKSKSAPAVKQPLPTINSTEQQAAKPKNQNINLKEELGKIELDFLRKAMESSGGNKEKAAKLLGLNRTTLIEKLKKYEKSKKK